MKLEGLLACSASVLFLASISSCSDDASAPASGASACGGGTCAALPAVIADIDVDYDDIAALAYLCQGHKLGHIKLKAVTISNTGGGYPGKAIKHARCMLEACGLSSIPVADGPLESANPFPASIREHTDKLLSDVFAGCTQSDAPSAMSAPELLQASILAEEKVTLLAFGPLTNLARALDLNASQSGAPKLQANIESVQIMGGAVHVPGNLCCGAELMFNNTQEFNFWGDPAAAAAVLSAFDAGVIKLVPLDATQDVPLTAAFSAKLQAEKATKEADVVAAILAHPSVESAVMKGGILYWWDPLSAVALVVPDVVEYKAERLTVVQQGPASGETTPGGGSAPIQAAIKADRARFEQIFLDTLNGRRASGR